MMFIQAYQRLGAVALWRVNKISVKAINYADPFPIAHKNSSSFEKFYFRRDMRH